MIVNHTDIQGVYIIEPRVFHDDRGFFYETINVNNFKEWGIDFIIAQHNCAFSKKRGTIRGLHYQDHPMAQAKLVRCMKGKVLDYAVDIRRSSPTYKKYVCVELTEDNHRQLYIPKGFAHGVISMVDDTIIEYFTDALYSPRFDRTIHYNDVDFKIDWPFKEVIVSEKDKNAPTLQEAASNF